MAPVLPRDVGRFTAARARVRCTLQRGRLMIAWHTTDRADHATLTASFRATFPQHGAATFNASAASWSVPLHRQADLAEWVSRHFQQECELGWMPWDPAPRPPYLTARN